MKLSITYSVSFISDDKSPNVKKLQHRKIDSLLKLSFLIFIHGIREL